MPLSMFLLSVMIAFLWGLSPLLQKKSMQGGTDPDDSNPFRSLGYMAAALCLGMVEGFQFSPHWFFLIPFFFLNVTISFVIGDTLFFSAVRHAGASLAMSIACCYPLVAILGAVVFLGEKLRMTGLAGTLSVIAGLVLVQLSSRRPARAEAHDRALSDISKGLFLALLTAFFWGLASPFNKWLLETSALGPGTFNFVRSVSLLVTSWAIWIWQRRTGRKKSLAERGIKWTSLLYLVAAGVLVLALANFLFTWCLKLASVTLIVPITASSPIFTMIIATRFMKEKLRPIQWIGGLLVVGGAILVGI